MALKFDAIFCDDIRTEMNGKLILIGVYTSNIIAPLPQKLGVCVHLRFFSDTAGTHKITFKLSGPDGFAAEGDGQIETSRDNMNGSLSLPPVAADIKSEGDIEFWVGVDGQDQEIAGCIAVVNALTQSG